MPLNHSVGVLPANLHGAIRAEGIHDHNLIAPTQAVEARTDIPLFVETDNDGGDRGVYPQLGILGGHVS